jgi:hypothetical protein
VKDNLLLNKTHIRQYIPLIVQEVPKPELIIWKNLDFVNKKLTIGQKVYKYGPLYLLLILVAALTCGHVYLILPF